MDQTTHNVRRPNWLTTITQCQERPEGISVKQWLSDNGVKEKAYYYWLRKFRKEAYAQMHPPGGACGTVDLHKGIDGLAMIIGERYKQNPFEKGTLFLFCGQRSDRIKGLLWQGTGFLLLYKRLEDGRLSWPRTTQEAAELTEEQFHYLMPGLNPLKPKVKDVKPGKIY